VSALDNHLKEAPFAEKHRLQAPSGKEHGSHQLAPCRRGHQDAGLPRGHSRIEHTERYLGAITPAQIDAVPDAFARIRKAS